MAVFIPGIESPAEFPTNFIDRWVGKLAEEGVSLQFHPEFDLAQSSGYCTMKVTFAPKAFPGAERFAGEAIWESQDMGLSYDPDYCAARLSDTFGEITQSLPQVTYFFSIENKSSSWVASQRIQYFLLATLASLTRGILIDWSYDESKSLLIEGHEAINYARRTCEEWEKEVWDSAWNWEVTRFISWEFEKQWSDNSYGKNQKQPEDDFELPF